MNDLLKHGAEISRAIEKHQYELHDHRVYLPAQKIFLAGGFTTWVNGQDMQYDPNLVPAEGITQILTVGLSTITYYIAPFLNNSTILSTLTAATFNGTLSEFTAYTQAARVAWTGVLGGGTYTNSVSPAVFTADGTVGVGPGVNVYGAALLSASAKSATTGVCVAGSLFSGARNLKTADNLTIQYDINMTSS